MDILNTGAFARHYSVPIQKKICLPKLFARILLTDLSVKILGLRMFFFLTL